MTETQQISRKEETTITFNEKLSNFSTYILFNVTSFFLLSQVLNFMNYIGKESSDIPVFFRFCFAVIFLLIISFVLYYSLSIIGPGKFYQFIGTGIFVFYILKEGENIYFGGFLILGILYMMINILPRIMNLTSQLLWLNFGSLSFAYLYLVINSPVYFNRLYFAHFAFVLMGIPLFFTDCCNDPSIFISKLKKFVFRSTKLRLLLLLIIAAGTIVSIYKIIYTLEGNIRYFSQIQKIKKYLITIINDERPTEGWIKHSRGDKKRATQNFYVLKTAFLIDDITQWEISSAVFFAKQQNDQIKGLCFHFKPKPSGPSMSGILFNDNTIFAMFESHRYSTDINRDGNFDERDVERIRYFKRTKFMTEKYQRVLGETLSPGKPKVK